MNPDLIRPVLSSSLATTVGRGGLTTQWAQLQCTVKHRAYIKNRDAIPTSESIANCVQCSEVHHGLCVTEDAEYYSTCRAVAKAFEAHFRSEDKDEYYELVGIAAHGGPAVHKILVYFASKRRRKQQIQLTHVFCKVCATDGDLMYFAERNARGLLDYVTPWAIAKEFVCRGAAVIWRRLVEATHLQDAARAEFNKGTQNGVVWNASGNETVFGVQVGSSVRPLECPPTTMLQHRRMFMWPQYSRLGPNITAVLAACLSNRCSGVAAHQGAEAEEGQDGQA